MEIPNIAVLPLKTGYYLCHSSVLMYLEASLNSALHAALRVVSYSALHQLTPHCRLRPVGDGGDGGRNPPECECGRAVCEVERDQNCLPIPAPSNRSPLEAFVDLKVARGDLLEGPGTGLFDLIGLDVVIFNI